MFLWPAFQAGGRLAPLDIIQEFDPVFSSLSAHAHDYLLSDIVLQVLPYRAVYTAARPFEFWNPYVLGGAPFFEDMQARSLDVVNVLASVLSVPLDWYILFSTALLLCFGAGSLYCYLRIIHLSPLAAAYGAIAFTFSSTVCIWAPYTLGASFLWLPFLLVCTEKIIQKKTAFAVLFSFGICCMVFTGHPESALMIVVFILLYGLLRILTQNKNRIRLASIFLALLFLGIGLTAVQSLPAYDFIRQSTAFDEGRSIHREPMGTVLGDQLSHPRDTVDIAWTRIKRRGILLLAPNYYGDPVARDYHYPDDPSRNNYFELASYAGILTAIVACFAIVRTRRRAVIFWSSVFFASFLLMADVPIANVIGYAPIINKVHLGRLSFMVVLAVSVLAAFTIHYIQKYVQKKIHSRIILVLIGCFVIGVLCFDLMSNTQFLISSSQPSINVLANNDVVHFLQEHDQYRFIGINEEGSRIKTPLIPNQAMTYGIYDLRGYLVVMPKRFTDMTKTMLSRKGSTILADDLYSRQLLDIYRVKYIVCTPAICARYRDQYPIVFSNDTVQILENMSALPRAYIAYDYRAMPDVDTIAQHIVKQDIDVQHTVMGETSHDGMQSTDPVTVADVVRYSPDQIEFQATAAHDGMAVVTDTYYPGWHATVDGATAAIEPVFGSLRGIPVQAGQHRIILTYKPRLLTMGLSISLISCCLLIVLGFVLSNRKIRGALHW